MIRLQLSAGDDVANELINLLTAIEGVEHVEEIGDLMPHMDDPDSSSAGLSDLAGPQSFLVEIEAPNPSTAAKVREAIEALAGAPAGSGPAYDAPTWKSHFAVVEQALDLPPVGVA